MQYLALLFVEPSAYPGPNQDPPTAQEMSRLDMAVENFRIKCPSPGPILLLSHTSSPSSLRARHYLEKRLPTAWAGIGSVVDAYHLSGVLLPQWIKNQQISTTLLIVESQPKSFTDRGLYNEIKRVWNTHCTLLGMPLIPPNLETKGETKDSLLVAYFAQRSIHWWNRIGEYQIQVMSNLTPATQP
jgi:hypothetical protein